MARRNVLDYERVLAVVESSNFRDKEGYISLSDLESVFVAVTDKVRPETIKAHIEQMCRLNLLTKRGELAYKLTDNWKEVVKLYKKV
jgi:hypothetical protein